jgi:RNA polymerase sigma factor (sigma-70 family)
MFVGFACLRRFKDELMTDYRILLADYVVNGSEPAFREVVTRYIDLVYSTAVRLVNGDTHQAEDITQTVFADLAQLAGTLSKDVMLGGWLHRRTWHVATTFMRNQRRRQHRERQAIEMNEFQDQPAGQFEQIAPLLDEAINQLNANDRAAIVLRFFEHRDLRAIGVALGSNEDAAQKRVSRAVEKLRSHFARRGIVASAAVIASVVSAQAVHAAPLGLASAVTAASLSGMAGSSSITLVSTLTKLILMKKAIAITSAIILVTTLVSLSTIVIMHARADAPVTTKSLQNGLVMDMGLDQDEAGGGIKDRSGNGNDGVTSGVHWVADDQRGGAYEFTADGDEIVVSNNASLNPKTLTLAAWIKTAYADTIWRRVFDKSYSKGYALSLVGDLQTNTWHCPASTEIGPGSHTIYTRKSLADGQWHQLVTTFDGTLELLYVDGQLQGRMRWDAPGQVGTTPFNLVIGCNRSNIGEFDFGTSFRGLIDNAMMWNRALSTNEVAFLFESQRKP